MDVQMKTIIQQKTFLLGVGAQKAGTTWLYDYLNGHPNANMGFTKEYHIFDVLYVDDADFRNQLMQLRINNAKHAKSKPNQTDIALLQFLEDTARYFAYFRKNTEQPGITISGDITPYYSALTADVFTAIKQGIQNQGLAIKVIFLMRDPVERCISAARMALRNHGGKRTAQSETAYIRKYFATLGFQMRTRYDNTITNLEKVFSPEEVHYAFYEELFTESSVKAICDFLRIPYITPDFNHHPNESRTSNEIPLELKLEIAQLYAPTYDFICNKFGCEKVAALWPNALLLKS